MFFKKLTGHVLVSVALTSIAVAQAEVNDGLFFFDNTTLPKNIVATTGSLSIDSRHYKDGESALLWKFKPNEKIIFNTPIHLNLNDQIMPNTFMVWIYNEKPTDAYLTFQFGEKNHVNTQFKASLNFLGWRGIAVPYRDMEGEPVKDMDNLTITAPGYSGELYLDQMMVNIPVDNRWPTPDYIVPFINHGVNTMVSKNWTALLMYDKMLSEHYPSLDFSVPFDDSSANTLPLYQKAELHLGINPDALPPSQEAVEKNLQAYKKFNIKQDAQGIITGPPLEFPSRKHYVHAKGVFSQEVQKHLTDNVNDLRTLGKTLLQTAKYLRNPKLEKTQREKLEAQFLLTTKYILDQGFVYGSGYQIITHLGYQSRELFDAWFLERHLLAEHNLLEPTQKTMMWFNATGRIFEEDKDIVDADVDILNTQLQWMLKSILMLPEQAQREALLTQLSHWLNKTIQRSKGVAGGFKADGSIFHHSQHYVAYARDAFGGLAPSVYILSATPYALDKATQQRLSDSLYKMWVYTKDTHIPIVLSGRHPTGLFNIVAEPFKWLALAGDAEHPEQINEPLAAVYARLTSKDEFHGVKAAPDPIGAWAMNHAAMAIQRRAGRENPDTSWLAVARGFSRYLVGNESYQNNNHYSRYLQYGNLEIIPADYSRRAFSHSGWDWNRYPGTTAIHLPFKDLKSHLIQLPDAGIEEMLLSTETYVGANQLENNSMFAMKLHGHSKYHQESFQARKSYFMFDNRVIALGSGIENEDAEHVTETTLFQHAVPQFSPIQINGEKLNQPGTYRQIRGALTLEDPAGNDYFVPKGYTVDVYYQNQQSPDDRNDQPTQGNFATAVINHGKAPQQADYEYAIVIDGGDNPEKPAYTVLHKDNNLHAVKDDISGEEDYAYFESYDQDVGGIVLAASAPTLVMAAPKQDQLSLSVVNPDLALYQDVEEDQVDENGKQVEVSVYSRQWRTNDSRPQTSTVTLKGQWKPAETADSCAKINTLKQTTTVEVTTIQALPCQIKLHK